MSNPTFVHLQVHSQFSITSSILSIEQIIELAKQDQAVAVGITDIHNIFGLVKLYQGAIKAKIKPFIGVQVRIWDEATASSYQLLLYCKNITGYKNICYLLTQAYKEGQRHGQPYIHKSWLNKDICDGLLAIEPGVEGFLATSEEKNINSIQYWLELFPSSYYFGITRVGHDNEYQYEQVLQLLCKDQPLPIVALNGVCFKQEEDYQAHEVRVAIQQGQVLTARENSEHTPKQFWRTQQQMCDLFADMPQALANSVEITKRLNVMLELSKVYLPDYPTKNTQTLIQLLIEQSLEGISLRIQQQVVLTSDTLSSIEQGIQVEEVDKSSSDTNTEYNVYDYKQRLAIELSIIQKMGYAGYFLIVADFIQWAKQQDIPVGPGRGSGAGSLVAYALGITDIDPLPHGLLFERFLNPERVSMPDFDIDFCMVGRDRVIDYVARRYGKNCVAQIITYGTMAAKAAVRDVGRAMALPYGFVDKIAKMIPNDLGITLEQALIQAPDLSSKYQEDEEVTALMDMALKLEGCVRNVGRHAGGVVIAPGQLIDFCPLYQEMDSTHQVTQFDMGDVEKAGLVKFDFLGLRTLTIIAHAATSIRQAGVAKNFDINQIKLDDIKTFQLLKTGYTTAVFQLESKGFQELIVRLQPDCFADIVALVALYRPGPLQTGMVDDFIDRKHGKQKVSYLHSSMESILQETYGVIVYQEQVMQIAQAMAGYSLGGADLLRRAMGKKKPEEMAKQRSIFVKGSIENDVKEELAGQVFDLMEKFAGYGFNKSHSVAYALIAYQTAFLKAHYIDYFMAAVLTSDMDNTDKVVHYCKDCEDRGLTILPPDVHASHAIFIVEAPKKIRFALGAIKGVGEGLAERIVEDRIANGNFEHMLAMTVRLDKAKLNRKVLEALIYSGALDDLAASRNILLASIETVLAQKDQYCHNQQIGQTDLFGSANNGMPDCQYAQPIPGWRIQEQLAAEKEVLGRYFSGHPLDPYQHELKQLGLSSIASLNPKAKRVVSIAGFVLKQKRMSTKAGRLFMIIELMDKSGSIEVACFDDKMQQAQLAIEGHSVVVLTGQVQVGRSSTEIRFSLSNIISLAQMRLERIPRVDIHLEKNQCTQKITEDLYSTLHLRNGDSKVHVHYRNATQQWVLALSSAFNVNIDEQLLADLAEIVGVSEVRLSYKQ